MLSAGSLQAQFSLGEGSVCEVLAHDVCKLGQPWPLVLLKPAQRPSMAERLKWEPGAGSRRYHKDPGRWSAFETEGQTVWASKTEPLEVISLSPCPWAHRD